MRIFLPARAARSRTATRRPRLPASMAHIRPAAPAPRTSASNLWVIEKKVLTCQAAGIDYGIGETPLGGDFFLRKDPRVPNNSYIADRFCRLDFPAGPCESDPVSSFFWSCS